MQSPAEVDALRRCRPCESKNFCGPSATQVLDNAFCRCTACREDTSTTMAPWICAVVTRRLKGKSPCTIVRREVTRIPLIAILSSYMSERIDPGGCRGWWSARKERAVAEIRSSATNSVALHAPCVEAQGQGGVKVCGCHDIQTAPIS